MFNDEFRHEIHDDFQFEEIKKFCRRFLQLPDINHQISYGMHNLVYQQIRLFEKLSPSLPINHIKQKYSIQFPIRVILAVKRFSKRIFERRKIIQQLTTTTLID